ncbi:MAG: CtsR family transcriptional regulator [Firmicutes bacterium]|nr:CtsR family transcriptional regulator [Bacillota bacterium]
MPTISDLVEKYILNIVKNSEDGIIHIQRTDLSARFSCVPSQINYVIKTRFTIERGFLVESKRGEGGFLKIMKIPVIQTKIYLDRINQGTKNYIGSEQTKNFLNRLVEEEILNEREKNLIWQLLKDESLPCNKEEKGYQRGKMIKNLIAFIANEEEIK